LRSFSSPSLSTTNTLSLPLPGRITTFSTVLIPILLLNSPTSSTSTSHLLTQWHTAYTFSQRAGPPTLLGAVALFSYLGFYRAATIFNMHVLSLAMVIGMVPFTLAFMGSVEGELVQKAQRVGDVKSSGGGGEKEEKRVRALVQGWARLNLVRAGLMGGAGVIGLLAL